MGLLSGIFPPSEADKRATEVRTGAVAPSRAERQKCWEARDAYFACLDGHGIVDALKDDKAAARACGSESAGFEKDCATQWVSLERLPRYPLLLLGGYKERGLLLVVWCMVLSLVDFEKADGWVWQVTYFKKWRVQDIQKKARLKELEAQGAQKMDVNSDFAPRS